MSQQPALVLLVEDDLDTAMLYQAMLNSAGIEVVHCPDCHEAKRWWADCWRLPDLLILDVGLPDGNGLDLVSQIPSRPELGPLPPVIVLSAHGGPRLPTLCQAAGVDVFMDKLAGLDHLVQTAARLISSSRACGQLA